MGNILPEIDKDRAISDVVRKYRMRIIIFLATVGVTGNNKYIPMQSASGLLYCGIWCFSPSSNVSLLFDGSICSFFSCWRNLSQFKLCQCLNNTEGAASEEQ